MSRVRSFTVAFNYLILNYLRLAYLRLNYLRLIYAQFLRHFLTAILLFLVLGCITSSDDIQPSSPFGSMTLQIIMWTLKLLDTVCYTAKVLQAGA